MRFLRLLFWLFLMLLALMFMVRNWTDVTVDLWGNLQADVKLPLLLLIAFLLGWLPTMVAWRLRLWRFKRSDARVRPLPPQPVSPTVISEPIP
ncbi:MAG: hypothetical protein M3N06_03995 [Pseudomonadota bacterium]|jgi:putative membrane protein|nr:hypothetical protein [Pseudomonadota bacterium]